MATREPEKIRAIDAEYLAGRRFSYQENLDEGDVLLIREAMPRQVLGVDLDDLLGLLGHQSSAPAYSAGCSGR